MVDYKSRVSLIEVKNSERIQARRLNFKKVAPLFEVPPECVVACTVNESAVVALNDYSVWNPLYSDWMA